MPLGLPDLLGQWVHLELLDVRVIQVKGVIRDQQVIPDCKEAGVALELLDPRDLSA